MRRYLLSLALLSFAAAAQAEPVAEPVSWVYEGTTFDGYLVYDGDKDERRPGLLMVPNWMGVTDGAVEKAKKLADDDYVILLVDMYGRGLRPADSSEAGKAAGAVYADRVALRGRINSALQVLRDATDRAPLDASRIGGIGFCFGGAIVLELARSGADVAGVVSFHGNLSTTMPAKEGGIETSVLVLNGAADNYVPQAEITAFWEEMANANADWQFVNFGGAVHCFAEADANSPGCRYDPLAARRAYEMMEDFLDERFGH